MYVYEHVWRRLRRSEGDGCHGVWIADGSSCPDMGAGIQMQVLPEQYTFLTAERVTSPALLSISIWLCSITTSSVSGILAGTLMQPEDPLQMCSERTCFTLGVVSSRPGFSNEVVTFRLLPWPTNLCLFFFFFWVLISRYKLNYAAAHPVTSPLSSICPGPLNLFFMLFKRI